MSAQVASKSSLGSSLQHSIRPLPLDSVSVSSAPFVLSVLKIFLSEKQASRSNQQAAPHPLTPLQSALTQNAPVTPSESALTKTQYLKPFRIRTYKQWWGGRVQNVNQTRLRWPIASSFLRSPSVPPNTDWRPPALSSALRWYTQIPLFRGPHGSI